MKNDLTINWAIAHLSNFGENKQISKKIVGEKIRRIKNYLQRHGYAELIILCTDETIASLNELSHFFIDDEIPVRIVNIGNCVSYSKEKFRGDIERLVHDLKNKNMKTFTVFSPPSYSIPILLEKLEFITQEEVKKSFVIPFGSFFRVPRLEKIKKIEELKTLGPEILMVFSCDL